MALTLTDTRNTLGVNLTLDEERMTDLMIQCGLSPETDIEVQLVPSLEGEDDVPPMLLKTETVQFQIPVQDRLEFSDKSLEHVNRDLVKMVRVYASMMVMINHFGTDVGSFLVKRTFHFISREAHQVARNLCKSHPEVFALVPKVEV